MIIKSLLYCTARFTLQRNKGLKPLLLKPATATYFQPKPDLFLTINRIGAVTLTSALATQTRV